MNTLFTTLMIAWSMLSYTPVAQIDDPRMLEMQIQSEVTFQNTVMIFDFDGNLIKELTVDDVASQEISVTDYFLLEDSHFAFSHQGDYYYLRD